MRGCHPATCQSATDAEAGRQVATTAERLERSGSGFRSRHLVLLVSFWLPWYSVGPFSADGLSVHGWLFIAVLVLYVLITAFGVGDLATQGRLSKDQLLAVLTGVNLVLVVLAFLLKPAGFSWSWGALLALAAAIVAFVPFGVPLLRDRRRR